MPLDNQAFFVVLEGSNRKTPNRIHIYEIVGKEKIRKSTMCGKKTYQWGYKGIEIPTNLIPCKSCFERGARRGYVNGL